MVAARYRLDRTLCEAWPPLATGYTYAALYLAALAALTYAWRRLSSGGGIVVGGVIATHVVALFAAPFLSSDPLMYVAIGRALAGGSAASTDLTTALGAGHPFLVALPQAWRVGTSAYGPGWNALALLLGRIAGDDLGLALRLHQGAALVAILAGAWLTSRAVSAERRVQAFVLVALCPLALVEGSANAHNDALLVPLVAGALLAWTRARGTLAIALLALGLLVKASMLVVLGPVLLTSLLVRLPDVRQRKRALAVLLGLGVLGLAGLSLLHDGPLDALARIVGRPEVAHDHCTRSLECLPRVLFRFVAHMPTAAWVTGLVFRGIGMLWLGLGAWRAAAAPREARVSELAWAVFFYFLLLHGWAQSWYLLPLLPALPFVREDARYAPAIRTYVVSAVAYYALVLPYSCLSNPITIAVSDLIEAAITVFPPVVVLLRRRTP